MARNPMHYAKHIKIRANGREYPTVSGSFTHSGFEREDVTGYAVHGFKKTAVAAKVSCEVPVNFFTDFEDINDHENVTIEVELDTGNIYLMANAWCVQPLEISDGNYTLEYHSRKTERIDQ